MRYKVLLLNYDSKWVEYCDSPTRIFAVEANADLRRRGFQEKLEHYFENRRKLILERSNKN